ncbi:MAG: hypothetical protein AAGF59_07075 [Pseudomonadota bacterium]
MAAKQGHCERNAGPIQVNVRKRTIKTTPALAVALALAACTGTPAPLAPVSIADSGGGIRPSESLKAVNPEEATFAFEPFEGIPVNTGDTITKQLLSQAETYRVRIVPRRTEDPTYRVRGHLIATADNATSIISYVYDIFDANGQRVHRIIGQDFRSGQQGDPWPTIADSLASEIATDTLIDIQSWLYAR